MNRKISFAVNEFYHVYNRGVEKRVIFQDEYDYKRFVFLLNVANSDKPLDIRSLKKDNDNQGLTFVKNEGQPLVDIGAWCLMPNHFHLLIREKIDGGLSLFLQKLLTAYSMYFNRKYNRKGSLFEGRFQAEHLNTDNYLKYIYSYIHLNPVKILDPLWKDNGIKDLSEIKEFLREYKYSSYLDYVGLKRKEDIILNIESFPEYFTDKNKFESNLYDWLIFDPTKVRPL